MITATFSKFVSYGIKNGSIKRIPAKTTVEKIVSGITRMVVYPFLLKTDAYLLSSIPIMIGSFGPSLWPGTEPAIPFVIGMVGAAGVFTVLISVHYIAVIFWILRDYRRNKLYIWEI